MASLFSSLLNSVGKDGDSTKPSSNKFNTSGTPGSAVVRQKRKAETELKRNGDKVQKVANGEPRRDIKPLPRRADTSTTVATTKPPTAQRAPELVADKFLAEHPYTRTGLDAYGRSHPKLPDSATPRTITASSTTSRPLSISGANLPGPKTADSVKPAVAKPAQKPPPKAGSFKAMLAKAKETASKQALGTIVHKPTENMSMKKQLAQAKAQAAMKGKGIDKAAVKPGPNGKQAVSRTGADKKAATSTYQGTARPLPAKPQSTYQGTARPTTKPISTYRGTARPSSAPVNRGLSKPGKSRNADEYLGTDESEGDYDVDDDGRYDDAEEAEDDYSDMEAGFDDVEEEDREAERQAKLDDLREQRKLEKLAQEKAKRKASRG